MLKLKMFSLGACVFCFTMALGKLTNEVKQKNPGTLYYLKIPDSPHVKNPTLELDYTADDTAYLNWYWKPQPVSVEYFKQGQVLLPDYACPDTLIVTNAAGLNKAMALVEQGFIDATDYELDSIMHTNCKIKN